MQKDHGWTPFCNGQMNYSLVGRDVEHDVIPFMSYAGIGMTVWSPLASGFLSGKYTRENLKDQDNRLSGFDLLPFDKEFGFKVVEVMKEIAAAHHASVAQMTKPHTIYPHWFNQQLIDQKQNEIFQGIKGR